MPTERVQRHIERLLDEADQDIASQDWSRVLDRAQQILTLDPDNGDAVSFKAIAERGLAQARGIDDYPSSPVILPQTREGDAAASIGEGGLPSRSEPQSFANGRYVVNRFLGEGGKKRVYLAHDTTLDRDVAFALIKTEGLDATGRERVAREAQAMGRLGAHPHIVTVFDLGTEAVGSGQWAVGDGGPLSLAGEGQGEGESHAQANAQAARSLGQPYMVTELMGGGDVEGAIEAAPEHKLPLPVALSIAEQVCQGLEFAHGRGIVHRDLKPGNVWLTAHLTPFPAGEGERRGPLSLAGEGQGEGETPAPVHARGLGDTPVAKIGDFGLAVAIDRTRLTQAGMMVGTVSYMPPEQAMGGEVTARSDLYSLGAMLYELVAGRPPFLGDDHVAVIGQHLNTPPVAPSWHRPDCPKLLEALILRLLAKDPKERPPSAADVRRALLAIDLSASKEGAEAQLADANALDSLAGGVFVGRQREMGELKAALEDALSGRGRLLMLVGEPGIGKTRIAQELATYAGLRGAQALWGRCYDSTGVPPYWPWVQAIRSYVREREPEQLRSELGSGAADIAEIASEVRERIPELKPLPALEPEQARFRLFDSVTSFLKAAGRHQPLVLVLEDLHWSDRPSLLLLEFLARELGGARLLIVGSYRDVDITRQHPLALSLGELSRERLFQRVLLRGLGREDVAKFIELTAGMTPPDGLVEAVHTQTEGNPLFVTEVVRLLVEERLLAAHPEPSERGAGHIPLPAGEAGGEGETRAVERGQAARAAGDRQSWTLRIPEGVREVIGRRLSRLSDRCNQVLTVAAVIGREFSLAQLRLLIDDLSEERLLDVLEEALAARVIEELPRAIERYQFTHALIQETLISELTLSRRVRLHARIAEVLEGLYGTDAGAHAAELASHYAQAETLLGSEKVAHYSLLAGERALASHAPEEALQHFQRALAAKVGTSPATEAALDIDAAQDAETADILFGLGLAQAATLPATEMQAAFLSLKRAFDFYASVSDIEHAVAVASYPLWTARPGAVQGADEMIARALPLVAPDSLEAGRLLSNYGFQLGRHVGGPEPVEAFERALEIARRKKDVGLELQALGYWANTDYSHVRVDSGLEKAARAIELAREVGDPMAESQVLGTMLLCLVSKGDYQRLRAHAERLLALGEKLHNRGMLGEAHWGLETCCFVEGNWRQSREYCDRGLELYPDGTRLTGVRVLLEYQEGNFAAGEVYLGRLREQFELPLSSVTAIAAAAWVSLSVAVARVRGAEPPEIDEALVASIQATIPPLPEFQDILLGGLGLLATMREDAIESGRLLTAFEHRRGSFMNLSGPLCCDRQLGLLAQTSGNLNLAADYFEEAIAACERGDNRPEWAWSACDYADLLARRGGGGDREKAAILRARALDIARELGMRPLMERVISRREILKA